VHASPQSSARARATCPRARRRPGPRPGTTATTGAARVHVRGACAGRRGWPPPCAGAGRGGRCGAGVACRPPAHPPAATGSTPTDATGRPVGQSTAMPTGTRPAAPSPGGPAGASTQRGTGGRRGGPTPEPNGPGWSGGPSGLERGGSWSSSPPAVRVQAVGLVGAGQPVGEVARALGVHPAAVRRWVWQAWRQWGTAIGLTQSESPDPPG